MSTELGTGLNLLLFFFLFLRIVSVGIQLHFCRRSQKPDVTSHRSREWPLSFQEYGLCRNTLNLLHQHIRPHAQTSISLYVSWARASQGELGITWHHLQYVFPGRWMSHVRLGVSTVRPLVCLLCVREKIQAWLMPETFWKHRVVKKHLMSVSHLCLLLNHATVCVRVWLFMCEWTFAFPPCMLHFVVRPVLFQTNLMNINVIFVVVILICLVAAHPGVLFFGG